MLDEFTGILYIQLCYSKWQIMSLKKISLSVVLISRNNEKTITSAINSIMKIKKYFTKLEILLVDSCSKDKTITLAQHYPISIYKLKEENISPSAGLTISIFTSSGRWI